MGTTELQLRLLLVMEPKRWYCPGDLAKALQAPAGGVGMALRSMSQEPHPMTEMKWVSIRAVRSVKRGREYRLAAAGLVARQVTLKVGSRDQNRG